MKFLIINHEHELYHAMMGELFNQNEYSVEEIDRIHISGLKKKLHDIHYGTRANKFFEMPLKKIWDKYYQLDKYPFENNEHYIVIFMNGSLRNYYNRNYLKKIKRCHPNVELALLIFDKSIYWGAKRAISMRDLFDYVFSFDEEDCQKYQMIHFYNCFSIPTDMYKSDDLWTPAFFVGNSEGRLKKCQELFSKIGNAIPGCKFYLTAVEKQNQIKIPGVIYNQSMSFKEEMLRSYNSECLIEIIRENQTGISLRVCEAIAFNKKLITNNFNIQHMPFYNANYMKIIKDIEELDMEFILKPIHIKYRDCVLFSPINILKKIKEIYEKNNP